MTPDPQGVEPATAVGTSTDTPTAGTTLSSAELAEIAQSNGLRRVGHRPPFGEYLRDLWQRRSFLWTLASAQAYAKNQESRLGQLWAVLNPILLAGAYYLIFGLLVRTKGGVDNYFGFLTAGIFTFTFLSIVMSGGSRSVSGQMSLVRSLAFPRALLPLSRVLTEMITAAPTFVVLMVIMVISGERPSWEWLMFPVALAMISAMSLGLGLILARVVHDSRDAGNLIPLVIRLLRYVSGTFFSLQHYLAEANAPQWLAWIMTNQPVAVMMELVRESLMAEAPLRPEVWMAGLIWSLVLPVIGMIWFWRGEGTYGLG